MTRRRQRNLSSGPPRVAVARGVSFSDRVEPSTVAGAGSYSPARLRPRGSFVSALTLASAEDRRGMGRTFRPMSLGAPHRVWDDAEAITQQVMRAVRSSVPLRLMVGPNGLVPDTLLKTPAFSRSLASLDRRSRVCHSRKSRRAVLFALRVAGLGRRRSAGLGGTYRRRSSSVFSCR